MRIVEKVLRIESRLQALQLRKTFPVIALPCSRLVKSRIRVVDVHAPVVLRQRRRDVGDPVVEEREAVGWVGSEE